MDIVITYVDGNDPVWQAEYAGVSDAPVLAKRFRDWGTLRYLLRGIERHMPFVDQVYLVVSGPTQVPSWASERLKIVRHADIIPPSVLPTFNSAVIEMFLHRIPGLADRFLFFNDDIFPVADCLEEDFFADGKIATGFRTCFFARGIHKMHCLNSDRLARKLLGMPSTWYFHRPQHTCTPMYRDLCAAIYGQCGEEVIGRCTPLRDAVNYNQYLYTDYAFYSGKAVRRDISNNHISLANASARKLRRAILSPSKKLVCINDVQMPDRRYEALRSLILSLFAERFPEPSRFERAGN